MDVVFNRNFGKEEDRRVFRRGILRVIGWLVVLVYGYFCSYFSYIEGRVGHADFILFLMGVMLVVYGVGEFISSIREVVRLASRVKLVDYSSFAYNGLVLTRLSVEENVLKSVENLCLYDGRALTNKLERVIPFEAINTVLVDGDTLVIKGVVENEEGYRNFLKEISGKNTMEPSSEEDLKEFRFILKEGYYSGFNKDEFIQFLEDRGIEVLNLGSIKDSN